MILWPISGLYFNSLHKKLKQFKMKAALMIKIIFTQSKWAVH